MSETRKKSVSDVLNRERFYLTVCGRLPPIRNLASVRYSVIGNGNSVPYADVRALTEPPLRCLNTLPPPSWKFKFYQSYGGAGRLRTGVDRAGQ